MSQLRLERGQRLKYARKQLNMTQEILAAKITASRGRKVQRNAVAMWECGRNSIPADCIFYLAEILNKTPNWLMFGTQPETLTAIKNLVAPLTNAKNVPLYSHEQLKSMDSKETALYIGIDTILADAISEESYALQVKDNSMQPALNPGDIIILDPKTQPQPGEIIVVKLTIGEEKIILGKYRPLETIVNNNEPAFEVIPLNNDWPSTVIKDNSQGKIVGTLVEQRCRRRLPVSDIPQPMASSLKTRELVTD